MRNDRHQNEFTKTIWDYLDTAVSEDRVALGLKSIARHRDLLERIEADYASVHADLDAQFVGKFGHHFSFDSDTTRHSGYSVRSVSVSKE